jgi:hypothetical protein
MLDIGDYYLGSMNLAAQRVPMCSLVNAFTKSFVRCHHEQLERGP